MCLFLFLPFFYFISFDFLYCSSGHPSFSWPSLNQGNLNVERQKASDKRWAAQVESGGINVAYKRFLARVLLASGVFDLKPLLAVMNHNLQCNSPQRAFFLPVCDTNADKTRLHCNEPAGETGFP